MNITRTISTVLITIAFAASIATLSAPRTAEAFVVTDPTNLVQNTLQVLQTTAQTFYSSSLNIKEYALDPILTSIAKQLLHQMTQSVVNWINSGFDGSPSFITDPGSFFLDAADQITGSFIDPNGPLAALCSPFGLDIRLSLALYNSQRESVRYQCTLGKIISNTRSAVNRGVNVSVDMSEDGATIGDFINGGILGSESGLSVNNQSVDDFLSGDFSNGGWPAFIGMTTAPQNNIYGAYLEAHSDLQAQIAKKEADINNDLNRGQGFLSWQKCQTVNTGGTTKQVCHVETPGSVIANSLNTQLGSTARELELADEINEVVNALIGQLVVQVLNGGLRSASGHGAGDRGSVVSTILDNNAENEKQLKSIAKSLLNNVEKYKKDVEDIYTRRLSMYTAALGVANAYSEARACWGNIGNSSAVANIDQTIVTEVTPIVNDQYVKFEAASSTRTFIMRIETIANSPQSTDQLGAVSLELSNRLQQQDLPTATDAKDVKDEQEEFNKTVKKLQQNAENSLRACTIAPIITR